MHSIFLSKTRATPDRLIFALCVLIAALWAAYEYGHYIGRTECFAEPAAPKVELRRV